MSFHILLELENDLGEAKMSFVFIAVFVTK